MSDSTLIDRLGLIYKQLLAKELVQNKEDFADKLGYSSTYVSELFSGRREISNKFQLKVENTFGIKFTEPTPPIERETSLKDFLPTKDQFFEMKRKVNEEALLTEMFTRLLKMQSDIEELQEKVFGKR